MTKRNPLLDEARKGMEKSLNEHHAETEAMRGKPKVHAHDGGFEEVNPLDADRHLETRLPKKKSKFDL